MPPAFYNFFVSKQTDYLSVSNIEKSREEKLHFTITYLITIVWQLEQDHTQQQMISRLSLKHKYFLPHQCCQDCKGGYSRPNSPQAF